MWKWLEKLTGVTDTLILTNEYQRARTKRGRFKGDDKSTADINEAWVGGKAPKRKVKYIKKKRIHIRGK